MIDQLTAVLPPPEDPVNAPSDAQWLEVFAQIGTRLPEDFIQFHKRYGVGCFASRSHPMSAGVTVYHPWYRERVFSIDGFRNVVPRRLTELRLCKERFPKRVPLPLYWEDGGILPWGGASNNTDLCWIVSGDLVDNWKVAVLRAANGAHEVFDMPMSVFLARVISGKLACSLMPAGFPGAKGVTFH